MDYSGWIPDSISWIPDSKAADSGFHRPKLPGFRIPDYLTWGDRFGFCDIQNNQGRGKGYQPKPKAEADNSYRSPASYPRKLLCLFCREKFCKKTVYSGIELICEFAKQCVIITKTCF